MKGVALKLSVKITVSVNKIFKGFIYETKLRVVCCLFHSGWLLVFNSSLCCIRILDIFLKCSFVTFVGQLMT
jgi:hypothetical protein